MAQGMDTVFIIVEEDLNNPRYTIEPQRTPKTHPSSTSIMDICRLCLDLATLQPLNKSQFAKEFNNFYFLGKMIGNDLPKDVCKKCMMKIDDIGSFLRKCRNSYITYKKMEVNCEKLKPQFENVNVEQIIGEVDVKQEQVKEEIFAIVIEDSEEEQKKVVIERKPQKVAVKAGSVVMDRKLQKIEIEAMPKVVNKISDNKSQKVAVKAQLKADSVVATVCPCKLEEVPPAANKVSPPTLPEEPANKVVKDKICPECGDSITTLRDHYKTSTDCLPLKLCKQCGATVTKLTTHYAESHNCKPRNFKCIKCTLRFSTKWKMLNHHRAHHGVEALLKCPRCPKTFKYNETLRRHIRFHDYGKEIMCEVCGKSFARISELKDHKNKHTQEKPYSCKICGKKFSSYGSCYTHQNAHMTKSKIKGQPVRKLIQHSQKSLTCTECNRTFGRLAALKVHMHVHAETDPPNCCKKCDVSFDTHKLYRQHMSTHIEKRSLCSQCPRRFQNDHLLQLHMRIHNDERPCMCAKCGRKFRIRSHLNRHMMLIHNDDAVKPFKCKFCQKLFALKENLVTHERIHTGERPYKCHVCSEGFIDSSRRKKHVIRKHGESEVKNIEF